MDMISDRYYIVVEMNAERDHKSFYLKEGSLRKSIDEIDASDFSRGCFLMKSDLIVLVDGDTSRVLKNRYLKQED